MDGTGGLVHSPNRQRGAVEEVRQPSLRMYFRFVGNWLVRSVHTSQPTGM